MFQYPDLVNQWTCLSTNETFMGKVQRQVYSRPAWERMVRIHQLLQNSEYPNCSVLAAEFEVNRRTIKREVDFMRVRLKLPIRYDNKRYGFYYTRPVEQFPQCADHRVGDVRPAGGPQGHRPILRHPFQKPLETAFRKLTGQLDQGARFTLGRIDDVLSFRPFAPEDTDLETFQILTRGLQEKRALTFQYKNLGAAKPQGRQVHPYHLACIDSVWYLFAFDVDRQAMRTFVLTRLSEPKLTDHKFTISRKFDPNEYLRDHVKVSLRRLIQPVPAAPAAQPIFRGHDLPRLRGAMVGTHLGESDLAVLANQWPANLIRWQLIRSGRDAENGSYDQWLDGMLERTDRVLAWAKAYGVKVVLDLHSPPGGKVCAGGYVAAMGGFFTEREAQRHFIEVWQKMARRYKDNPVIWGFDLVNEPVDEQTSEDCLEWQDLALAAGKAIREIDPDRVLIVEPPRWDSPAGWIGFNPIPLPRVVYSFHMYEPGRFTHQRVFNKKQEPVAYPGEIEGQTWNRDRLIKAMQPAIDFARKYRVHMYVGEFSAIRWAPGAEKYLADVTSVFEEQGWDWSYHAFREWSGWSLEHGVDEKDSKPGLQPTARFKVIESWLQQNQRAQAR